MCASITPRVFPSPAMINANSPTCARLKPVCSAVLMFLPAIITPNADTKVLPKIVINESIRIGNQYSARIFGSTIIPTETKNIAPNKSLMLLRLCSMCSPSTVSPRIEPIMKAPKADEKPVNTARVTMPKHKPTEIMSRVSSFISFFERLKKVGKT